MRAAMVGGGAYIAGKKVQEGRQQQAEQDAGPTSGGTRAAVRRDV